MQRKMFLLGIIAVVSVGLVVSSLFFLLPLFSRQHVSSKDKVETIFVSFENGENMTVYSSTSEGAKLLSACEDFMSNINAQWMWAVTDKGVARAKNSSLYVVVELKDTYNFTFFVWAYNGERTTTANTILFFLSGSQKNTVLYARVGTEEFPWSGSFGAESRAFQNLVNVVSELS